MRLNITKTKNFEYYYIIHDVYLNKKRTTKIYESLGTLEKIKLRANGTDPIEWLNNYIADLNKLKKEQRLPTIIKKYANKQIDKNKQIFFNAGYLFLQKIYYDLGIDNICKDIINNYQFKYDLNSILSRLIYSRIIYPSSKLKTMELSKNFVEQPNFELHDMYRSLGVIAKESDFIQQELYKNSLKYSKRNDKILYYDCTNYFFEIEDEEDDKKYGPCKENRPLPIIQMGLFLDGDGIPLAFDMTPGNTNEQLTLKPLEEKIIKDFGNAKFVVCTDAGLASTANRKFNNTNGRRFITTQSVKKLKSYLKEEAIDLTTGWKLQGSDKVYNISKLRNDPKEIEKFKDTMFYKERWIKENDLEQRLIVTYSVKYQEYQKKIRESQIRRACKLIEKKPSKLGKVRQNDAKRFINNTVTTKEGEIASKNNYSINNDLILEEAKYDGIYAVCTNLEDDVTDIMAINRNRWEIEESFRIMKSEFKARPVYLSKQDRIKAHFTTCFLALVIYRYLEKKINESRQAKVKNKITENDIYTVSEIIDLLKEYNLKEENEKGYSPLYTRTDFTDFVHDTFGFRTDYEIVTNSAIKKIINNTKKQE